MSSKASHRWTARARRNKSWVVPGGSYRPETNTSPATLATTLVGDSAGTRWNRKDRRTPRGERRDRRRISMR